MVTDRQREALAWILAEAIDVSNGRRRDLASNDATHEWDDLQCVIALVPGPEGYRLAQQLGPRSQKG